MNFNFLMKMFQNLTIQYILLCLTTSVIGSFIFYAHKKIHKLINMLRMKHNDIFKKHILQLWTALIHLCPIKQ